jgi:hypothetical protein
MISLECKLKICTNAETLYNITFGKVSEVIKLIYCATKSVYRMLLALFEN